MTRLGKAKHETLASAPDHAGTYLGRIPGSMDDRAVFLKVDTIVRDCDAYTIPRTIGARFLDVEEIVLALMVV